ncbi:EAL domain-containing protein [Marinobacterium sp. MBR-109]|jgi:diguanylate cyclase (GGDEF)-like protein/PAS domain S-box-containing protein|uniref:EAL domain-containing protein n=1 Tax=Marinobacterium sp. MBR-109 TaxID=3156462 RepID=UPI00339095BF
MFESVLKRFSLPQLSRMLLAVMLSMLLVVSGLASVVAKGPEFEQVFRESGVMMLLIEPDSGRIIEANAAAAAFYGYPVEQLQRMSIQQINTFTPEQVAQERALAEAEGRNYFLFRHRLADGEVRTVEVHSRPYYFNEQNLLFSIITDITPGRHAAQDLWHYQERLEAMVDAQVNELERSRKLQVWLLAGGLLVQALVITILILNIQRRRQLERERRRTTAALELSSERLREAQRIARVGSWELNHTNQRFTCSDEMYRLLDLDPSDNDSSYRQALSRLHPEDRQRIREVYSEALRTGKTYEINHRLLLPGDIVKHVSVCAETVYTPEGEPVQTLGTVQDITEQQLTRQALAALATSFAPLSGKDFYEAVSRHLVEALGVEYAFVARLSSDGQRAEVLAGWSDEGSIHRFSYALADTPCADVLQHHQLLHENDIQTLYPQDLMLVDMGAQAYIGSALLDKQQQPVGLLVALSQRPLQQAHMATGLMQLFVDRVSAEMQRSHAEQLSAQADRYRQIVLKFSSRFINLPLNQIESALDDAMREIGSFFDADRCYLFEYDFERKTASMTFEWCAKGVDPQAHKLQQLPMDEFPNWIDLHGRGEPIVIADLEQVPDPFVAEILKSQGTKSLIDQPLMGRGSCSGFIGISSMRHRNKFGSETVALLKLFAELLVSLRRRELHESQLRLSASVFDNANEGIMITNPDGNIVSVNNAFTRTTGYAADEVMGRTPAFLNSDLQGKHFHASMWQALQRDSHWSGEVWNRHKAGELYAVLQKVNAFYDEAGRLQGYVSLLSDITTLKLQQKQLEQIAHFDPLTGLPNRTLLADRLQQAMAQANRHDISIAVLFIDLDGFKAVNDTHSHAVGDQLLVQVARRMKRVMRDEDTLARLGGDEFVAVLQNLESPSASTPVLERLLQSAAEPVQLDDLELAVSASIGVVFYPQQESLDADQLQRQADQAMYQAKQAGKNRYHLFDVERDRAVRDQHESLERIREALYNQEFKLFYQPKVNMRTGEVIGCEALIRWQHPERGLLPPAAFLPVIENHPLAIELGHWVLCTALDQLLSWKRAGIALQVSVNIDAIHLQHASFVERLDEELQQRPEIQPGDLELEILETTALDDVVQVSDIIIACQRLGVGFALDDFGTGYSSLTYLKCLPAELLKIDRSFVRDMLDDPDDLAILDGVIRLAQAFRRSVIAEGVETQAHCQALLDLGCELGQGYAIARPMPNDELSAWLQQWTEQWQPEAEALD